ncbi:hypothetical protein [Candidatus Albibeggiatoa sp. nov. BB20]|uniref:hypothetical protein n=1 Tax=Candidatus Albibeggiatoa sp. nov. BB20 TaxID=3162723 RepID=UPI0033657D21
MFDNLLESIVALFVQFITIISPKPRVIKQLEQEIGTKLNKYKLVNWGSIAYRINLQQQVIALSLYECEIKQNPECLCTLSYLQELCLPRLLCATAKLELFKFDENKLKELPASFGQLQKQYWLNFPQHYLEKCRSDTLINQI